MRVSDYFKLGKTQPYLDFVDVPLDTDIPVFIDPTALRGLASPWGQECTSLLQYFFEAVISSIKDGDNQKAQALLGSLSECNEFHLGFSKNESRGHGFGSKSAGTVWKALSNSKAIKSGLLKDLEDSCLLVDGVGTDMISDAVCNILRGPLIRYTQDMARYYGIPLKANVASGPIWNAQHARWESQFVELPVTSFGKIILVPKLFVRLRMSYRFDEYYTHYLLPEMQDAELHKRSSLVQILKDGRRKVYKKHLREKYGEDKAAGVEQTLLNPQALEDYRAEKTTRQLKPLYHNDFAEIEGVEVPDWDALAERFSEIPPGKKACREYEDFIEQVLTALFYPALNNPRREHEIHEGRKRIDLTYTNEADGGFFAWLSKHFSSAFVFIECKNYGKEVGNPEVDQLSGRFSPSRGKFGILVVRSVSDEELLSKRCKDTAKDDRGYVITLTDSDLVEMLRNEPRDGRAALEFPVLRRKFRHLID